MRKFLFNYFLFTFFLLTFISSGFLDSQDGLQYLTIARRMYYDQTFEMPESSFDQNKNIHMSNMEGKDGKIFSITGLGYSVAMLPAVALEDIFLRVTNTQPIEAFPLESDWPVLLFASMTNTFFGALLVIGLYLYMLSFDISHKYSFFLSLIFLISTNLLVYTKHSFAQMMFSSLLLWVFYLIRRYYLTKNQNNLYFVGLFFGVLVVSYNQTFVFPILALIIYYLLLIKPNLSKQSFSNNFKSFLYAFLGMVPFIVLQVFFNKIRFNNSGSSVISDAIKSQTTSFPPPYVVVEGIWSLLFSPGKSIFLFSPILLILILFWFKLNKKIIPEIISFLILFITYLWLIGTLLGGPDFLVWHGDSSWGPRYLLPTLPLLLILIANIFKELSKKEKLFIFYPLVVIGMCISLVGISLPYQIRFQGLEVEGFINGQNFNVYQYGNLIPRYSPVFSQTKTYVKRLINIRSAYDHGKYNIRLSDGFDYPFDLGWTVWRGVRPLSVVNFDNTSDQSVNKLSLQIKNHQIDKNSSQFASFKYLINGKEILAEKSTIGIEEEFEFIFNLDNNDIKDKDNKLLIFSDFESSSSAQLKHKQALFLQILRINDIAQNIQTLDYPYVSKISEKLLDLDYVFWGKAENDPWEIWHMHSGVYEKTLDFWWLRPLNYWDMPKDIYLGIFIINSYGLLHFGYLSIKSINKHPIP